MHQVVHNTEGAIVLTVAHEGMKYMYTTDRSKAVVPVLLLFCVALWFLYYGRFMF